MALQDIVQQTVIGLGLDLIEIERSAGGLLRITIDLPWAGTVDASGASLPEQFVNVEDCEKVTRQLRYALEVEEVDYKRLEVSSPGIDRPLRHDQDLQRFTGQVVDITLKEPVGDAFSKAAEAAGLGVIAPNRKKFRGTLEVAEAGGWQIVWSDEPVVKPGARVSKKRVPPPLNALGFTFDELREARLAPIVDFKGRRPSGDAK